MERTKRTSLTVPYCSIRFGKQNDSFKELLRVVKENGEELRIDKNGTYRKPIIFAGFFSFVLVASVVGLLIISFISTGTLFSKTKVYWIPIAATILTPICLYSILGPALEMPGFPEYGESAGNKAKLCDE